MPTPKSNKPAPDHSHQRGSEMAPLVLAGAVAILVVVVALVLFVASYLRAHPALSDAVGALLVALVVVVIVGAIVGVAAGARWLWGRAGTVKPDEHGIIPVPRKALRQSGLDLQTLPNVQRTALARATRIIPEGVHTVTHAMPHNRVVEEPEVVEAEIVRDVPPLSVLLREGLIKRGEFCIGFNQEGEPIYGTWEDFCTIGAGGTMGTGKSNDGAFYLAQVLANGGEGYVADPNAGHSQSLANRLGRMAEMLSAPVAKVPEDILRLVQKVRRILAERIATNDEGDIPVILLIDEFTAIMLDDDLAVELPKLLSIINTQGRKYGVFVFLLAQLWGAEMTGGTKVRNLLAGRICHNLPMQEARNLLGLPASAMPKDIGSLRRGECYVRTLQGALHRVTIPLVDAEGVADLRKRVVSVGGIPVSQELSRGFPEAFPEVSLRAVPALPESSRESAPESAPESVSESLEKWAEALDFTPTHLRALIVAAAQRTDTVQSQIPTMIDPMAKTGNRRVLAQQAIAEVIREGLKEKGEVER